MSATLASDGALILVVDDNEPGRYAKARILRRAGYEVLEAKSGEEALLCAASRHPELMLIDVRLPDLNGRHVSLRLRNEPTTADIAILQTSATHTDTHHRVLALEAGADAYLAEPVEPEELVASVRALLRMRRAEAQLRVTESRFRVMAESIGDVFWILDPVEMRFEYVSPAFATLWGRPVSDVIEDMGVWIAAIHPEDRDRAQEGFRALVDKGEYDEEFRIIRPQGTVRWIANRGFPMRGDATKRRVVGVAQDVTERKGAEEKLIALDRRKDEFLAMLAHELRNPLGPIRNAVEILRIAPPDNGKIRDQAREMIGRQVTHMGRLVDDLLDVSRITQGKITLRRVPVKVSTIATSALELARPSAEAGGHRIEVALPEEPLWIDADPVRLAQVIGNMLNNASKFTPPGGKIRLSAEKRGERVAVIVEDTGIGMPAELVPEVFDLFAQGDRSLERSTGGLGVGLALVKRLVELHGGTVTASSKGLGKGSRFEVVLSLVTAPVDEVGAVTGPQTVRTPRKILVVDDSRDAAEAMSIVLSASGHDVMTAFGAYEAIAKARAFRPDVVFLDIGLPEMDGYTLAGKLRQMPETKDARLLALTGYGQAQDRERALASGFDEHLVKPLDPQRLDSVIG